MGVLRPRNRLVNFRLSEEEFDLLRNSCGLAGARSVSDFARSAVLSRLEKLVGSSPEEGQKISALDHKVSELESRLSQLLSLMRAVNDAGSYNPGEELAQAAQAGASQPTRQY